MLAHPCPRHQSYHGLIDVIDSQVAHAAMVEMTGALLARPAWHLLLQANFLREEGVGPIDERRPEKSDNRPAKRRREMPRPAIGAHKEITSFDTGLRQSERNRLIGQR